MRVYCALYTLRTDVGFSSGKYFFNARDDGRALRVAKVHAQKLRNAFGDGVRVNIDAVLNRSTSNFVYDGFSDSNEGFDRAVG